MKLYQLKDFNPTWMLVFDLNKTATSKEYADTKVDQSEVVSTATPGKILRLNANGVIPAPIYSIPTIDVGGNIWITNTDTGIDGYTNPIGFGLSAAPTSPQINQLWFDASNRRTKLWDGSTWQSFNEVAAQSSLITLGSNTAPSNPQIYQIWYDVYNKQTKIWDGTQWTIFVTAQSPNIYKAVTSSVAQTINSSIPTTINGLSITLTPTKLTSKFLIMAVVNGSMGYVCSSVICRNGLQLITGGSNNNNTSASKIGANATTYFGWGANNNNQIAQHSLLWVDTPGVTTSITYDIRHMSAWAGGTYTTIVNDRAGSDITAPSSMVVIEF
jgi:hypothetical protein